MQVENVLPVLCWEGKWNIGHEALCHWSCVKWVGQWAHPNKKSASAFWLEQILPFSVTLGGFKSPFQLSDWAGHTFWELGTSSGTVALLYELGTAGPLQSPRCRRTDPAQVTARTGLSTASCINRASSPPGSSCVFFQMWLWPSALHQWSRGGCCPFPNQCPAKSSEFSHYF